MLMAFPVLYSFGFFFFSEHRTGQRKHSLGRPDQRDLSENLAATQGLAHMVTECIRMFQVLKLLLLKPICIDKWCLDTNAISYVITLQMSL